MQVICTQRKWAIADAPEVGSQYNVADERVLLNRLSYKLTEFPDSIINGENNEWFWTAECFSPLGFDINEMELVNDRLLTKTVIA
jgi:hypothetical protein